MESNVAYTYLAAAKNWCEMHNVAAVIWGNKAKFKWYP